MEIEIINDEPTGNVIILGDSKRIFIQNKNDNEFHEVESVLKGITSTLDFLEIDYNIDYK